YSLQSGAVFALNLSIAHSKGENAMTLPSSHPESSSLRPAVLVPGSSGLIGSRVVEALSQDYRVIGMDVKLPLDPHEEFEFVEADLTDDTSCSAALTEINHRCGSKLSSVVHLAAYYDF